MEPRPRELKDVADAFYRYTQLFYPGVLLMTFVASACVHSIVNARTEEELLMPAATGPGGKPLPVTRRKREHRRSSESGLDVGKTAKRVFQYVSAALLLSFLANGTVIIIHALVERPSQGHPAGWWCDEERTVYVVGSSFLYLHVLITLFDWKESPITVHLVVWSLALVGEIIIFLAFLFSVGVPQSIPGHGLKDPGHVAYAISKSWGAADTSLGGIRLCLVAFLVIFYVVLARRARRKSMDEESREATPLLNSNRNGNSNGSAHTNGSADRTAHVNGHTHPSNFCTSADASDSEELDSFDGHPNLNGSCDHNAADQGYMPDEEAAFYRPDKLPHKTWFEYCRGYKVFFPYVWPGDSVKLQCVVLLCFLLVVALRLVNIMVPYQMGVVTDILETKGVSNGMPWSQLALLIFYRLLQGESGLLGSMRSMLWIPVSQHTYRALTTAAFEHVHSLSLDFHLGKRTGELLSALNKGGAINQFLEQTSFQMVPMMFDLLAAIFFFQFKFGSMYALFVSIITFYYLYLTIRMAATRADQRRDMVNADREEEAVKNDSITSYETVKYFNAEKYEFERYRNAIRSYQVAEARVTWGINHMNMCQSLVFMLGILVCMMTCAFEVSSGTRSVGDFVLLVTYLGQLQGPLNFFGTFYRVVQQAMISGERLLELFKIQPTVVDRANVQPLVECSGGIEWKKVGFSYDNRRTALCGLSFQCKPGTTTAFVGESGGGKSTVFRLMFRYYNCREGSIEIDGHDVKDLTIDSVRRVIGVVPQDTIMFNESLMYNLRYANPAATDEDVFEACRAAAIHDRIMSFPDRYDTRVGERGLRLSGGEKQRVAIARTILKNPKIIMLDEATSALDGETEQKIQAKLISGKIGRDRTLLIIAHRLSTITHADQIIVLHAGTIAEKGTHEELLSFNGRYASMWEKHCRAERAAEEAREATNRAHVLMSQANLACRGESSDSCRTNGTKYSAKHYVSHAHFSPDTSPPDSPVPRPLKQIEMSS